MHQQGLNQVIIYEGGVNHRQGRQHLLTVTTRRGVNTQHSTTDTAAATDAATAAGGWLAGRAALLLLLLLWPPAAVGAAAAVCCCAAVVLLVLFPAVSTFIQVWQGAALGLLLPRIPACVLC